MGDHACRLLNRLVRVDYQCMNPPTEQLIRDYLNRLSVASRSKLGFSERQALLDRTRARIELDCGGVRHASAVQVRKILADLGDPIAVVELEHARLSANKEAAAPEPVPPTQAAPQGALIPSGSGGGSNGAAQQSAPPAVRLFLDAPVEGQPESDDVGSSNGTNDVNSAYGVNGTSGVNGEHKAATAAAQPLVPKPATSPESSKADSQKRGDGDGDGNTAAPPVAGHKAVRDRLAAVAANAKVPGLVAGSVALGRRNRLEVLALLVLGVGGAVYPIFWLLGAGMVISSKKWDLSDKIAGIFGSILLVIIGTVLVLVFGGQQHSLGSYAYEAWLAAGRLSRGVAVAGAGYLLWRLHRGRRQPKLPPWNLPHRVG